MLRLRFSIGLVLSLMLGLILCTSLDLEAARRSRRSRTSAVKQRQKMIAQLQSQIKSAQKFTQTSRIQSWFIDNAVTICCCPIKPSSSSDGSC